MKNKTSRLWLITVMTSGSLSFSHAAFAEDDPSSTKTASKKNAEYWDRADKARANAQEAQALADIANAEWRLEDTTRKRKLEASLAKNQLETAIAKEALEKAAAEAKLAALNADASEAQLRAFNAQMQIQDYKNTVPFHLDARVASAKTEQVENELKLEKTIEMKSKLGK